MQVDRNQETHMNEALSHALFCSSAPLLHPSAVLTKHLIGHMNAFYYFPILERDKRGVDKFLP